MVLWYIAIVTNEWMKRFRRSRLVWFETRENKVSHMTPTLLVGRAKVGVPRKRFFFSAVALRPREHQTFPGVLLSAQFSVFISSAVHFLELHPSSSSSSSSDATMVWRRNLRFRIRLEFSFFFKRPWESSQQCGALKIFCVLSEMMNYFFLMHWKIKCFFGLVFFFGFLACVCCSFTYLSIFFTILYL